MSEKSLRQTSKKASTWYWFDAEFAGNKNKNYFISLLHCLQNFASLKIHSINFWLWKNSCKQSAKWNISLRAKKFCVTLVMSEFKTCEDLTRYQSWPKKTNQGTNVLEDIFEANYCSLNKLQNRNQWKKLQPGFKIMRES